MKALLSIQNLQITSVNQGLSQACVQNICLDVGFNETVALVGESGSGKSLTALAVMQMLPATTMRICGEIWFDGLDILKQPERKMPDIRGKKIGMVFQNPMTSLNPTRPIGGQLMEGMIKHEDITRKQAYERALELLAKTGIKSPRERMDQLPYQLSGGMRQRVGIAIAISCNPSLIIADEPTTALDTTTQAQILELLKMIQKDTGASILLITHDLGVAASIADRVYAIRDGLIVEKGAVDDFFYRPKHPYAKSLIQAQTFFASGSKGLLGGSDD